MPSLRESFIVEIMGPRKGSGQMILPNITRLQWFLVFWCVGMCLTACTSVMEASFEQRSNLLLFVQDAELRCDDAEQVPHIKQFFEDMIHYSPNQIHHRRFPNNHGLADTWTAPEFLNYYVRSTNREVRRVEEDTFYIDLNDMRVKTIFAYWHQNVDKLLPPRE